jgi:hypothetical protein
LASDRAVAGDNVVQIVERQRLAQRGGGTEIDGAVAQRHLASALKGRVNAGAGRKAEEHGCASDTDTVVVDDDALGIETIAGKAGSLNVEIPVIGDRVCAAAIENRMVDDDVSVGDGVQPAADNFGTLLEINEAPGIGLNRSTDVGNDASLELQACGSGAEQLTGIGDVAKR